MTAPALQQATLTFCVHTETLVAAVQRLRANACAGGKRCPALDDGDNSGVFFFGLSHVCCVFRFFVAIVAYCKGVSMLQLIACNLRGVHAWVRGCGELLSQIECVRFGGVSLCASGESAVSILSDEQEVVLRG
eukprot:3935588-Rhodomonas_salina.1